MVFAETNFPRGGNTKSTVIGKQNIEFGATISKQKKEKPNKKQRNDKRKNENIANSCENIEAISAELLSFRTISDGMIIMGSITELHPTNIIVSLPGRMFGQVLITSISAAYTNFINQFVHNDDENDQTYKSTEDMFEIGQIICVKVTNINMSDEHSKYKIQLSMRPEDIQHDFHHQYLRNGLIMSVAIEAIEKHGYIIETGVTDLRGFLSFEEAPSKLHIGQVVFCKLDKIKHAPSASTAQFKFVETGARKIQPTADIKLSHIVPSTIVQFKVVKILKDGIQGTIMDDLYTGYINEHQLQSPLSQPNDYKIDSVYDARILYVMPITKLVYLSLNLDKLKLNYSETSLDIGTVVENAKVMHIGTGGVILQLNKVAKGLISLKSIRLSAKYNFDADDVMAKYHKNSLHSVRVVSYDPMDSLYICTDNERVINEKYFSLNDIEIGDYVEAKINRKLDNGDCFIQVGNIKGYIEKNHLSNILPSYKLNKNAKLRCRVIRKNAKSNKIFLTNRKELMSKTAMLLKSYEKAVIGLEYHGMIVKIYRDGYLVSFCNYVKGMLPTKHLDNVSANPGNFFYEGQVIKFRLTAIDPDGKLFLGLAEYKCQIGMILQGRISTIQPSGLHVAFSNTKFNGFVPTMFLSTFPTLAPIVQETYQTNDSIDAVCITQNVYSVKDLVSIQKSPVKQWADVQLGDIVPAFVKNVSGQIIDLLCLIENHTKIVKIHAKMLLENYEQSTNINLIAEQLVYVRILDKNNSMKTLNCSAKLSDVWHGDLKQTANIFSQYLNDVKKIQNCPKTEVSFTQLRPGMITNGHVEEIAENPSMASIKLADENQGLVTTSNLSKNPLQIGQEVECLVIWVDYANKIIYVTIKHKYIERMKTKDYTSVSEQQFKSACGIKADILLILNDVIVTYPRKLTSNFIYVPTQFHINDFQPCIAAGVREGDTEVVHIIHDVENQYIGMFDNICQALKKIHGSKKKKATSDIDIGNTKRRRLNSTENLFVTDRKGSNNNQMFRQRSTFHRAKVMLNVSSEANSTLDSNFSMINTQMDGAFDRMHNNDSSDSDEEISTSQLDPKLSKINKRKKNDPLFKKDKYKIKRFEKKPKLENPQKYTILPGITSFWNADTDTPEKFGHLKVDEKSVPTKSKEQRRKLQTPTERFQMARDEETRISKIENDRITGECQPSTTIDFERLILANPNDSATWINYMVFYLQTNNVAAAREIGRRALKKMSYREEQELFNIWIALINLELRFGDVDSFDKVLKESFLVNDPFKIYGKCIHILADMKKVKELTDMILIYTKKFRSNPECWTIAATGYFEVGLVEKAKQLLQRALASLSEREHINTIIKFANLNNKYNNKNEAHALLEQVLTSYPKRVDCWSQYVDMLVKNNEIELARQVLDRAVTQRIPIKKMRTLFKKYLDFEERFGDEKSVKLVKVMASSYVENEIKPFA